MELGERPVREAWARKVGRELWCGEEEGVVDLGGAYVVVGGEVEEEERGALEEIEREGERRGFSSTWREKAFGRMRKGSMAPRRRKLPLELNPDAAETHLLLIITRAGLDSSAPLLSFQLLTKNPSINFRSRRIFVSIYRGRQFVSSLGERSENISRTVCITLCNSYSPHPSILLSL